MCFKSKMIIILAFTILSGCSFKPFPISPKHTVTDIKIEPNKGPKSVYRPERFV